VKVLKNYSRKKSLLWEVSSKKVKM